MTMSKDTTHTRIYKDTLKDLRRIHAETGETIIGILSRLVSAEWERVKHGRKDNV